MNVLWYLDLAAQVAVIKDDSRTYRHGGVGLRRDGVLVAASNGSPQFPEPLAHCEARLCRKLGKHGVVFLVRVLADGSWGNTFPCSKCQILLMNKKVKVGYFSTGVGRQFTVWFP